MASTEQAFIRHRKAQFTFNLEIKQIAHEQNLDINIQGTKIKYEIFRHHFLQ